MSNTDPGIRLATQDDLPLLPPIERAAGQLFPPERLPDPNATLTLDELQHSLHQGLLLVAETVGLIAGFAASYEADGTLHLQELSVHPDFARQGIGRALLEASIQLGAQRKLGATTLTTFTDFPWNAPFYRTAGFTACAEGSLSPHLKNCLEQEADAGLEHRVAMSRPN